MTRTATKAPSSALLPPTRKLPPENGWVRQRFDSYGRAFLVGGLFLTPVAFYLHAEAPFSTPKLTVVWFSGIGAMACWLCWSIARRVWMPRPRLGIAALAFVGAAALATAFSLSPRLSLVGLYGRYGGLVPLLVYVGTMFALVGLHWERPQRLGRVLAAIGGASVVVAAWVVAQEAGVDRRFWAGPVPGTLYDFPFGPVGHSNFAGAHLGLGLPCLWFLARTAESRRLRSALGAAIALDLLALWFTQSRGGMLAALVGVGAMAMAFRERLGAWAKAGLAVSALSLVALIALVATHPSRDGPPESLGGIETLRTKTLDFRLTFWQVGLDIFVDHPFIGTGLDTFYAYYPPYRTEPDAGLIARVGVDKPHNVILEHATDSGTLGLLTYMAAIGLALRYGYRRCRQVVGQERALLAGFVGLLAGYLAQASFSIDQPSLAVLGWVAVGGIATLADPVVVERRSQALASPPAATETSGPSGRRWLRRLAYLALTAAVGVASVVGLRPLRADVAMDTGRSAEAMRLDPFNAVYRLRAGLDADLGGQASRDPDRKRELFTSARRLYLEALQLQPNDVEAIVRMAAVETAWASELDPVRFAEAERWWQRALDHDPNDVLLRQAYEQDFAQAKRESLARLEAEAQVRPDDAAAHLDLAHAYRSVGATDLARQSLDEVLRLDPASEEAAELMAQLR